MDYRLLEKISKQYGESFYILDSAQFTKNYLGLENAFRAIYPNTFIAYSYKTNYTPKLCKIADMLGGYAEIVSDMEYELSKRIGVKPEKIIFNGPYKNINAVEEILVKGGLVNIDSIEELDSILKLADRYSHIKMNVGIRVNFKINDNSVSRFGIDIESEDFEKAINSIRYSDNINLKGLHCHFAPRDIGGWSVRSDKMLDLDEKYLNNSLEQMDLGGGLFGNMKESMKKQFDTYIPNYNEYAEVAASKFRDKFKDSEVKPMLFIEPGTALVGDVMRFAAKVVGIKDIRGKSIATLLGSVYNINPTLNKKNPPVMVYHKNEHEVKRYDNLDFGGYTCIESDYLYRGYTGDLAIGDYVVFDNVGSYSVVLKPPFILPNFSIVDIIEADNIELIKRAENFNDIFCTWFDFREGE